MISKRVVRNQDELAAFLARDQTKNGGMSERENSSGPRVFLPTTLHDLYWWDRLPSYLSVDYLLPDGMPIVWKLQFLNFLTADCLKSKKRVERLYGPDIFLKLIEKKSAKHVFIASSEVLELLSAKIGIGRNGLFHAVGHTSTLENVEALLDEQSLKHIEKFSPEFIWVGVASPKQVILADKIKRALSSLDVNILCVGAAFDFVTELQPQAPRIVQKIGFEWMYRFLKNPQRNWKKYFVYSILGLKNLVLLRTDQ